MHSTKSRSQVSTCLGLSLALLLAPAVLADGGVVYHNIADGGGAGIDYVHAPSARLAQIDDIIAMSPIPIASFFFNIRPNSSPMKAWGAPGVALLDYDGDGDLDIYAANGAGAANSLYANQFANGGGVTFVDVAAAAGVSATAQESSGVCFGDIDNDGDEDLYVLGTAEANLLFENQGDGTFADITVSSGAAGDNRHSVGCSFADFDADGLLDLVVANSYDDWSHRIPVFSGTYSGYEHNKLFMNDGGNTFIDASATSGIEQVSNMSGPGLSGAAFTWALTTADHDLDGDVDILFADNQGAAAISAGLLRLYENDGTGIFTEVTADAGLDGTTGGWMGADFADYNCDGYSDFFATDLGYLGGSSRWWLGNADGTYTDSGAGNLQRTPFGWGISNLDYDNDGDSDLVYHGGVDLLSIIVQDNPGVVLQNSGACSADFVWDSAALAFDHQGRNVQGVAAGDLNCDGFEDIVTVSNFDVTTSGFTLPMTLLTGPTGSPFDAIAVFEQAWNGALNPGNMTYLAANGRVVEPGTLSVEISDAANGNGWVEISTLGSAGILSGGTVNRDGIGAVVSFTPDGGSTSIRPVSGGSSYASQDALAANFGLGSAAQGTADILWPGGIKNRLYDVASGEKVRMPHIPCGYDADWKNFGKYNSCVMQALNAYKSSGLISAAEKNRLRDSARRAFNEAQ